MKTAVRIVFGFLILTLVACDNVFGPGPAPTWSAVPLDERVTDAYTGFGFELFRQLRADDPDGNVFVSPTSAAFALAVTYNGAVGQTAEEMAQALGIDDLERFRGTSWPTSSTPSTSRRTGPISSTQPIRGTPPSIARTAPR